MTGFIDADGAPAVLVYVAGQDWHAVIDTGFNGDLELPSALQPHVNARLIGATQSLLGAGRTAIEDVYLVDFPFDGQTVQAEAPFVPGNDILLGTGRLRRHRLEIDFPGGTVVLTRVP